MKLRLLSPLSIILALVLLFSWAFFFSFLSDSQKQLYSCNKEQQKLNSASLIESCKDGAWIHYHAMWDNECLDLGMDVACDMPKAVADKLDAILNYDYKECVAKYSVK